MNEFLGKIIKALYPDADREDTVGITRQSQVRRQVGIMNTVADSVKIIPRQPDQRPDKNGEYQANQEDVQLVPVFFTPVVPGFTDQINKPAFQLNRLFIRLDGLACVDCNCRFLNTKFNVIVDLDGNCSFLDLHDLSVNPSDGYYFLPFVKRFPELLLVLAAFHLRTNKKEVKDYNDKQKR